MQNLNFHSKVKVVAMTVGRRGDSFHPTSLSKHTSESSALNLGLNLQLVVIWQCNISTKGYQKILKTDELVPETLHFIDINCEHFCICNLFLLF